MENLAMCQQPLEILLTISMFTFINIHHLTSIWATHL